MEINHKDELTFIEDDFRRQPIAEKLIEILLTSPVDISPIVIDGDWGTGKTFFCKKTKALIEDKYKDNILSAYIDAFAADHANEPLITILAAISKLIKQKTDKEKFLNAAKAVAKYSIKAAGKAGIAWALRTQAENLEYDFKEAIQSASKDAIDYAVSNLIHQHENALENINTLKQSLIEITKSKSLIIFIDELDRCRPDFAVAILEVIKHIFDVPGVKFVLVANLTQMKAAINHRYGLAVDAKRYLDKFIKYSLTLPVDTNDAHKQSVLASCSHINLLVNNNTVLMASTHIQNSLTFIRELVEHNGLSLREVETFVRYLSIYTLMNKSNPSRKSSFFDIFSIFVIFIFCFHPKLKEQIIKKQSKVIDLCSLLGAREHRKRISLPSPTDSEIVAAFITIGLHDNSIPVYESDNDDLQKWSETMNIKFVDCNECSVLFDKLFLEGLKKLTLQN